MATNPQKMPQDYAIKHWGEGYFGINDKGHIFASPSPSSSTRIDLRLLAEELKDAGITWPILVRFTDILENRVEELSNAFTNAIKANDYTAKHTAVYPIKVNQQRSVIEKILDKNHNRIGLEAGSKPELMAVLSVAPPNGVIVCNGYKDREYIRLALIGQKIGHRVYIVLEKPNELKTVLDEAERLGCKPLLGMRIRTAVAAASKWQNTGGEKAKFGLNASQILCLVNELKSENMLDRLQLLHAHLGSQIPDINDLRAGMQEVAHYYAELRQLGASLNTVDVGGGLGIDYEGTRSRNFCSINYSLADYASTVVASLADTCKEQQLPHPDIFTESGRAMTAHHAVLITNVIERESAPDVTSAASESEESFSTGHELLKLQDSIGHSHPRQIYQEARHLLQAKQREFRRGKLSLQQRAAAESAYFDVCRALQKAASLEPEEHQELVDELNGVLADKLFLNFSLFQSTPDMWGIGQVFPVIPLHRLNGPSEHHAVVHDMTCDSDGSIEQYVESQGIRHTLPVSARHKDEPYLFGIFLLGAYQEILGDLHNLFGDTNMVTVALDEHGTYDLSEVELGDSVDELLSYVHFSPHKMLFSYREKLRNAGIALNEADQYYAELESGLHGYTYHED